MILDEMAIFQGSHKIFMDMDKARRLSVQVALAQHFSVGCPCRRRMFPPDIANQIITVMVDAAAELSLQAAG